MSVGTGARPALIHPVSISAVGLLLLNDHVLKDVWPGAVTGKLSDFAGLVFFPLLLAYLLGLLTGWPTRRVTVIGMAATAIVFTMIQIWHPAADLYRHGLGLLQFPFRVVVAGADAPTSVAHTADPTDLMALPALLVAWWAGLVSDDDSSLRLKTNGPNATFGRGDSPLSRLFRRAG